MRTGFQNRSLPRYFSEAIAKLKRNIQSDSSLFLLLLVVLLSSFLRFWNLGNTPLWYSDEGTNLNLAWNLANGRLQVFATSYAFVSHPPLFYLASGLALKAFGYSLVVARMLTAAYGVVTTVLLFFIGKDLAGKKVGLTASFLFAIFPLAVLYNRWDFDFNLLQLLATFTLFACLRYYKTKNIRWLFTAAASAGAASVTSFIGIGLVLALFVLYFVERNIKVTLKAIVLASGFFAAFILSILVLNGDTFLISLGYGASKHSVEGLSFFKEFWDLLLHSPWFTIGILGILAYPLFFRRKRESIIMLSVFSALVLFTLQLFTISGPHFEA